MHAVAALLVAQHLDDLLREAEAERRAALVDGARRSAWSLFLGRVAGLVRRLAGSLRRQRRRDTPGRTASRDRVGTPEPCAASRFPLPFEP